MKGFPNQVADLQKLATGMAILVGLVDAGDNAKDDGIFGEELVRGEIAGTGHTPIREAGRQGWLLSPRAYENCADVQQPVKCGHAIAFGPSVHRTVPSCDFAEC